MDEMVTRLGRVRDEDLREVAATPAARALMTGLMAEQVPAPVQVIRQRTPAWRWRIAVAAAVVAAVVAGPGLLGYRPGGATTYANSAIEVHRDGGVLIARIKDPLADGERFTEAFRAFGQDVRIELVPVPPRLVGQLLQGSGGSDPVSSELVPDGPGNVDCERTPAACVQVVRVPTGNDGTVRYTFGRTARPGEAYRPPWTD